MARLQSAPPPRRRRRWLTVLGILAFLMALPVLLYLYYCWSKDRELDAVVAEIEKDDPRWRFDEILADRPPIADADNPALVVGRVDAMLRPGNFDLGPKNYRYFEDDRKSAPRRLNGPQVIALRVALERHADAVKVARTLKQFKGEGRYAIQVTPDYISTILEPLHRCRGVMLMLESDAQLRAEDEDAAGALESCRALLVAARSIGDEPYLIAMLVRVAGQQLMVNALERTLAQSEKPPAGELQAMQELLAREIDVPILFNAIRGERGGYDKLIDTLASQKMKLSTLRGLVRPGPGNTVEDWLLDLFPGAVTSGRAEHLRLMNRAVEGARLPIHEQKDAFDKVDKATRETSSILVRLVMPAVTKVSEANRRSQANLRSAMVALAVERYRLEHDRWPDTLADVVKAGLLDAVPLDPINGQPLLYRRLADGVAIHSVGFDGIDDGGKFNRANPREPGFDLGVRLWDVDRRRQNPLPPPPIEDDGGGQ
jgi:hypothetical protein